MSAPAISPSEALLEAARRFNRASFSRIQTVAGGELNHSEWHLLWVLSHWPDAKGARPSELAQRQQVTAGNVAQQLSNLEKQKLISRSHSRDDRRVVLVKLTAQGKRKLQQLRSEFVSQYEHLVAHLGSRETEHFIRLLTASADYLGDMEPAAC